MSAYADATRARAAELDHEWDRRAVEWDDIGPSSVVVEVGGYTGRWALQIAERYAPRLYVFEPQPWAAAACRAVLGERATVLDYALGTQGGACYMGEWETDGCSFIKPHDGMHEGDMVEVRAAFAALALPHIDLMLINIEGYEYTLIPHMLDKGIYPRRLMVQFHTFADPGGVATARIYERLARSGYTVLWTYGVVLTAWERSA